MAQFIGSNVTPLTKVVPGIKHSTIREWQKGIAMIHAKVVFVGDNMPYVGVKLSFPFGDDEYLLLNAPKGVMVGDSVCVKWTETLLAVRFVCRS